MTAVLRRPVSLLHRACGARKNLGECGAHRNHMWWLNHKVWSPRLSRPLDGGLYP